jgi:hypothetical protein
MDAATRRTLRRLARSRSTSELAALFAAIRAADDAALLAIAQSSEPTPAPESDFAADIAARLSAILARADEKADMLCAALAREVGAVEIVASGLQPTIRKLAARYGEDAVRRAVDAVLADMAAWGSTREHVS